MGKNELSTKETTPRIQAAYGLPAAAIHQSYRRRSMEGCLAAAAGRVYVFAARGKFATLMRRSTALAGAGGVQGDDLAARGRRSRRRRRSRRGGKLMRLRHLLGDAHQLLAPGHLVPDVLRLHACGNPEHDEIVNQIRAFTHHSVAVAV